VVVGLLVALGLLVHEPGHEAVGLSAVLLPLGPPLVLLLQKGHSAYESNQQSDEEGREEGDPAPLDRDGDEPNTPPEDGLSEVVGMARVPPQAMLDELLLPWGSVRDVVLKLFVAHEFKDEAERPHADTYYVGEYEGVPAVRVNPDEKGSRVDDEGEEALQHKHVGKSSPVVAALAALLSPIATHVLVSEVFALVALSNMPGESDSPNSD
jgi:hypothetical protein